jgi:hypothetical protein
MTLEGVDVSDLVSEVHRNGSDGSRKPLGQARKPEILTSSYESEESLKASWPAVFPILSVSKYSPIRGFFGSLRGRYGPED